MTVTFNTQLNGVVPIFSLDDEAIVTTEEKIETLDKKFFASQEAKTKAKQYPTSHWWVTRVYHTTSEKPPINWVPADYSCYGTMADVESGFIEWLDYLPKHKDMSGFKVVTMCLDMLNGTSQLALQFSKEHFQPKEKIFINGPMKKPFPAKAAKHYAV